MPPPNKKGIFLIAVCDEQPLRGSEEGVRRRHSGSCRTVGWCSSMRHKTVSTLPRVWYLQRKKVVRHFRARGAPTA